MDPAGIAFGVASALSWGGGDFAGGVSSRTLGSLPTAAAAQLVGLAAMLALVLVSGEQGPGSIELAWSVAAGIGGSLALAAFYRALATGQMGVVAPLAGAIGAGVPVVASLVLGERVGPVQSVGIVAGLAAVVLASLSSGTRSLGSWNILLLTVAAGLGFAAFFVAIDRASAVAGHLWTPLVTARASGVVLFAGLLVYRARSRLADVPSVATLARRWPLLVAVGLGDLGGNIFFLLADSRGPLSIAVVLSSLYPVTTALLAWLLLRERLSRGQVAGAALAVAAIVLLAA